MALNQKTWRVAGGVCIACCAFMAWFGSDMWFGTDDSIQDANILLMVVYWTVFTLFLVGALGCVWLDMRYIRLEYAVGKRAIFESTIGEEQFREALRQAQHEYLEEQKRQGGEAPPPENP